MGEKRIRCSNCDSIAPYEVYLEGDYVKRKCGNCGMIIKSFDPASKIVESFRHHCNCCTAGNRSCDFLPDVEYVSYETEYTKEIRYFCVGCEHDSSYKP